MAEEPSFLGVIERLKAEGLLNRNSGSNSIKSLKEINAEGLGLLVLQMGELIDFFKGNALQDEENRREFLKALKGSKKEEKKEEKVKSGNSPFPDIFGKGLSGLAIAVAGLAAGFVAGIGSFFLGLLKPLKTFITESKIFKGFKKNTIKFGNAIKGLGNAIKAFVKNSKVFRLLGKIFKPIGQVFSGIGKAAKSIKGAVGSGLGKRFKSILDTLKSSVSRFKNFLNIGKTVGTKFLPFLGKLFLPLTIIISLFDSVKGAMEGFNKYKDEGFVEGLIGGFFGAIGGFLEGFIGLPLDLLKSAISWVAGKLGFENFSEMLDSFSFKELIGGLFTKVTDIVVGFIGSIKETIANIGVGGMIKNISLDLLKIFKKVAMFPVAVAAGAAAALAAALPGGKTPVDAFKEGFSAAFNAGDAAIDSFKTANNTGARMEVGMASIADANALPAPVVFSGGGNVPQSTNVSAPSVTVQNSAHIDESYGLTQPSYAYA